MASMETSFQANRVAIVPVAVLIAVFQERVVGGLTQGGLKG
jgi:multiple sugar transport system permease protein